MKQLTKTQVALIANAGTRADGALLPAPDGITGITLERGLDDLMKKGIATRASQIGEETGSTAALVLTDAGRAAVAPDTARIAMKVATAPERPGGKLGVILKAVERKRGATIREVTEVTGWQPHTARAAMTRLRQRGFPAVLSEERGRKAYRLQR